MRSPRPWRQSFLALQKRFVSGDSFRLSYTLSNLIGQPVIHFQDGSDSRSFTGEEIRQEKSALGLVLTVDVKTFAGTASVVVS